MSTLILGSAKSAQAAKKYLLAKGEKPLIYDDYLTDIPLADIEKLNVKQVVISPGFYPNHPVVKTLQKKKIPIFSELELGLKDLRIRSVGLTGTNGKTTVSLLIEHVLHRFNIKAKAIGNIGIPITEYLLTNPKDEFVIVELSSYQLERVYSRNFDYGMILNIHPHHLDRYSGFTHYAKTKLNLLTVVKSTTYITSQVLKVFPNLSQCELVEKIEGSFPGVFQENLDCAFCVCKMFGVSEDFFFQALQSFQKPEHRLEWVANIFGVDFYNDSKATNVNAVIRAIESFHQKIILIAGGYDCKGEFISWKTAMKNRVRKIFAYGQSAQRMHNQLKKHLNIEIVNDMNEGIDKAMEISQVNEIVLLSPGCPSFGDYKNYEQRGNAFKTYVKAVKERKT